MKTNREIAALVAEKVMGLDVSCLNCIYQISSLYGCRYGETSPKDPKNCGSFETKNYSTDIKAAWEVVEKMKENGFFLYLTHGNKSWACGFTGDRHTILIEKADIADTAPMAICLAALKAKGIEV